MPMRIITFKLPEEIYSALEKHARRRHTSISQIIRDAIGLYLAFHYTPRSIEDEEWVPA